MLISNRLKATLVFLTSASLSAFPFGHALAESTRAEVQELEAIKAYCIDFNWGHGRRAGFAKPGTWNTADPKKHVAWYKAINANVIQTFAVSCNGYAWYKSKVLPEQPGLKHDFLTEMVKLGHAEGMKVMGYFCIAANERWGKENPTLSYGHSGYHIPYTDEYLAYLSTAITDAIKVTGMDGFMIDWVWMPKRKATQGKWLDAEKKLYQQLMGTPFPGEDKLTKEENIAYGRAAIDRCWKTIHSAAKTADPDSIIWLTTNSVNSPLIKNSNMTREVDWIMGEKGVLEEILKMKPMVGKHTRLLTCMSDYGGSDAESAVPDSIKSGVGIYGYAKPDRDQKGGTINIDKVFPKQLTQMTGNHKRIAVLARAYGGHSLDSIWKDGKFTEPQNAPPFKIKFRKRSSRHSADTGRVDFDREDAIISINSRYHKGRVMLTRKGESWPKSITFQMPMLKEHHEKKKPSVNEFRAANGQIGVSIKAEDKTEVIAGKVDGGLELQKLWKGGFLNQGKPKIPLETGPVVISKNEEKATIILPSILTEGNPSVICFEWGIDGHVF